MTNELKYKEELNNDKKLFEDKFNQLENCYTLTSKKEIHKFIQKNPGILILLDALKPHLKKDFANGEYELYVSHDPEIIDYEKLVLIINVDYERYKNGIGDEIRALRREIYPLKRKMNLFRELLIMPGVLNV
ncbi:MAG: hypothetical protein IK044_07890 [Methanobrevibacter sp.]|nr:hypothetical protein [Methanobrevibacter sp.]